MSIFNWLKQYPIPAFFLLTFGIAWATWLLVMSFAPEQLYLTLPGIWAPTISALILVHAAEGWSGVRTFLKKLFHWRVGLGWYVVTLFGTALLAGLAIGIGSLFGISAPALTLPTGVTRDALPVALPIIFLLNIFIGGPLAEDIGWRGYILPKLRERMPALPASLMIGVVWVLWHGPFFMVPGWRGMVGDIPFIWFSLLTIGWSVLFAWVYVNTESILMPVLYHAAINTTLGTLGVLGHGSDGIMPLALNVLITWLAVWIVVAVYGFDLRRRERKSRVVTDSA